MALRLPKIKLHNQILLALLLGAIFGVLFNVSKYELQLTYRHPGKQSNEVTLSDWTKVEFVRAGTNEVLATFGDEDQLKILPYFSRLTKQEKAETAVWVTTRLVQEGYITSRTDRFTDVVAIEKVQSIATLIRPVGTIFIRLLMLVAIPLVISSLIVGAASLGDIKRVGRIGARTLSFYALTIVLAISTGLVVVNIIQPGTRLGAESREKLMTEFHGNLQEKIEEEASLDVVDTVVHMVATNPFEAMARGEMLQIVFFALMIGVALTMIPGTKAAPVIAFFDGFSELMIKMVDLIMKIAPFGVFALIAATVGEFGFEILQTLAWYAGALVLGLLFHLVVTLSALLKIFSGVSPLRLFRGTRDVMLIGFSSSSSAATLPVNMEACEQNLGVPKQIASFVLPLGATVNMDGTSMYQAVATVFIAQVYGVDLGLSAQLTIILTAVLASIGTAPVPGVGIVMLIIVLRSVHVPQEGIVLILGIDRILDMCRTVVNVMGDAVVAVIVAKKEGVLGTAHAEAV
jgi:proton glutamate symport protein